MKRGTNLCVFVSVVCLLADVGAFAYSGGDGSAESPYQIADSNDLLYLGGHTADYNSHFILTADINLAGYSFTTAVIAPDMNSSSSSFQGTEFTGTFDGNDHLICNLVIDINSASSYYLGLFGRTDLGCEIKNLSMIDVNIVDGNSYLGGLVGYNYKGTISNCYANSSITGNAYLGGLAGTNYSGTIDNCYAEGVITGKGYDSACVGGLVGHSDPYGTISSCYAGGVVRGSNDVDLGSCCFGGLVGMLGGMDWWGEISNSWASSEVRVSGVDCIGIGGLVGTSRRGTISNSYATGSVEGIDSSRLGGLVGLFRLGAIENCYAYGTVDGGDTYTGGLVGQNSIEGFGSQGEINSCFWDIEASGMTDCVGGESPAPNCAGKTTAEMQTASTFTSVGWDFVEIWDIGENQTYPFLRTYLPSDINKDKETNFYDLAILALHWLEGVGEP